jgi:hypothetical protein
MAETNAEFGRAVAEVLDWMGVSPETAGAALGINARTLNAMTQGIVPMRSLVLKFSQGVSAQAAKSAPMQSWWEDPDAWLTKAGYPPRREGANGMAPHGPGGSRPTQPMRAHAGIANGGTATHLEPPPARPAVVSRPFAPPAPPSNGEPEPLAFEHYHPVYERQVCGGTVVHVFWIMDGADQRCFQIHMPAQVDYKARAAQVKSDLHSLTRSQFERKYGRFRVRP